MNVKQLRSNLATLAIAPLLFACGNTAQKKQQENKPDTITAAHKTNLTAGNNNADYDSLISTPCAIIVYPTTAQIEKMKKKDGEDFIPSPMIISFIWLPR